MSKEIQTFVVDPFGKREVDQQLVEFLVSRGDSAVSIDLSAVTEVTAARLEILISAFKQRGGDGAPMVLLGITDGFQEGLDLLGVPRNFFQKGNLQ